MWMGVNGCKDDIKYIKTRLESLDDWKKGDREVRGEVAIFVKELT